MLAIFRCVPEGADSRDNRLRRADAVCLLIAQLGSHRAAVLPGVVGAIIGFVSM